MNSFPSGDTVQMLALGIAVLIATFTLVAVIVLMWGERPPQKDTFEPKRLQERLAQISQTPVHRRKSA